MKHVDELRSIESDHQVNLSREVRAARGQYFTPEVVGRRMADRLAASLLSERRPSLRIIDPFCGDGRLLEWFLDAWSQREVPVTLAAWDTDDRLVASTRQRLEGALQRRGQAGEISVRCGDSFADAVDHWGQFDAVVTNPPWEAIKPDRRHLADLPSERRAIYIQGLRDFDQALRARYPEAQPSRKFAGWGTNLSRVGMSVAHRLARPSGHVSIVMPGSVVADTNHDALRSAVTEDSTLLEVASYPAEARLFDGVDVHFVTIHLKRDRSEQSAVRLLQFDVACQMTSDSRAAQPQAGESDWLFPLQPGAIPAKVLSGLTDLPVLDDLLKNGGYWAGRELDETGFASRLRPEGTRFLKGRNIRRFGQEVESGLFVDPKLAEDFPSTQRPRLVWRDVSRPSQRRRVNATLIPPGPLTGNSLGVLTAPNDDRQELAFMLGVFSSAVFEGQLRTILTTGHVTLASLRKVRLPLPTHGQYERIAELVEAQIVGESIDLQRLLEREVCAAYGLTDDEVEQLFASYEWLPTVGAQRSAA